MNARPLSRRASWVSLGAAFTFAAAAVMQATASPSARPVLNHAAPMQPLLSAQGLPTASAARPAAASMASPASRYYQNAFPGFVPAYDPAMARLHTLFQPHLASPNTSTGDPVVLQSYSSSEVVHVTDAAGGTVRAPMSASDPDIGPGVPLTFTVKVNNGSATTTATNVYLQIKNPNSMYQGTDGLEHKVFTYAPGDPGTHADDGSQSAIYNGGLGFPTYLYTVNNVPTAFRERGSVGGTEGTDQFLGIGHGTTLGNFTSSGQEYECQYLDPFDNGQSTPGDPSGYTSTNGVNAAAVDYGTPYYLAGYDDQAAGSFSSVPSDSHGSDWLQLHQSSTDPTLYTATWVPPAQASDFYLDVIVVDNARNWRIYDNVWGFSTLYFNKAADNDILFVSDNTLGQKFAASALSGGIVNLRPVYYGAESYLTDVSTSVLPDAVYDYHVPSGATSPSPQVTRITAVDEQTPDGNPVINALGYGSYTDDVNFYDTTNHVQQAAYPPFDTNHVLAIPKSQAYSLWRILCRGPLDPTLLTTAPSAGGYATQFVSQPAVNDPSTGVTAPASPRVAVATRCVVWASPFTGDQPLTVGGSINDPSTQALLRAYVNNGGRLFVTGQEVANTLTEGGAFQNAPTGFVYDVLNARFSSSGAGSDNQTLAGTSGATHPIGNDAYFNSQAPFTFDDRYNNYFLNNFSGADPYTPPGAVAPLVLGNNYDLFADTGTRQKWRTDGALTQLGPSVQQFGNSFVQGQISIVTPVNGAAVDFTDGGGAGLLYRSNYTSASGSGYGSKVIFASFGLEGLGNEYYAQTIPNSNPAANDYFTHNDRPNILHNIVSWMRTGSYQGRVFLGSSTQTGIAGATVYLTPFGGVAIPGPRQVYSAITADGLGDDGYPAGTPVGTYHIDGLEPGAYIAVAYKNGYTSGQSPTFNNTALPFTAAGDTTVSNINLNINPLPPGSIAGTVVNASANNAPVSGALVTFTSTTTPTTTITATTGANGTYSVSAPAGTYTGVATSTNPAGSSAPSAAFTVTTGQSVTENFSITTSPGTITGTVVNGSNGNAPVSGATVSFTLSGSSTPTTTTTTGSNGTFTSPGLPAGTYTVTVSAAGLFDPTSPPTATVVAGQSVSVPTITLQAASAATLTVTVTAAGTGAAINNATVTVTGGSVNTTLAATGSNNGTYSGSVPEGSYTVTAAATTAQPGQYVTATQTVNISTSTASTTFVLQLAPALASFPAGKFSLVSWPYTVAVSSMYPVPFDVFGIPGTANGDRSDAFNYQSGGYVMEGSGQYPVDSVHPGYGYFIKYYGTSAHNVYSGTPAGTPPAGSTVTIALNRGWNMIGVPSTSAISVSRLAVVVNGNSADTFGFDAASSGANVYASPVLYSYDANTGTYAKVVSATGPYATLAQRSVPPLATTLSPYQGYWLYAYQSGLMLSIPTGGG